MIPRSVARLALTTLLLSPLAVVSISPAAAAPVAPCAGWGEIGDPVAQILFQDSLFDPFLDTPTTSCASERQECMSASAQTGIYGERYVPPDAVAMCMEAYRDCIGAQSGEG